MPPSRRHPHPSVSTGINGGIIGQSTSNDAESDANTSSHHQVQPQKTEFEMTNANEGPTGK